MRSVLLIALVLVVSLAAAVIASGTGKAPNVASSNSEQAASERSRQSMKINIRIANKLVTATLVILSCNKNLSRLETSNYVGRRKGLDVRSN